MRRHPTFILAGFLALASLPLSAQAQKPRVSVAPLAYSLGVLEGEVRALSALFETALVRSNAFTVVKQDEMATVLSAQEASLKDYADRDSAVELEKILAASHIFVGTVAKLGRSFVVSLQLVEVRTGRAVEAESDEALRAYRDAARLAGAPDFWTQRLRRFAEQSLVRAYTGLAALPGGVLTDRLALPVPERLEHVEYLVEHGAGFPFPTPTQNPEYFLAVLSLAAGKAAQAERVARAALPVDPAAWQAQHVPLLEILEKLLLQRGTDRAFLDRIRARLKEIRR